jgi:predicted transcriptional regulator
MSEGKRGGVMGRPPALREALVEVVADLYARHERAVTGEEIVAELAARGVGTERSRVRVLRTSRDAGVVASEAVGRYYLYRPV